MKVLVIETKSKKGEQAQTICYVHVQVKPIKTRSYPTQIYVA